MESSDTFGFDYSNPDINESDTTVFEFDYEQYLRSHVCGARSHYIVRMVIFALFISFGIIGNLSLLVTILSTRQLRNAPNILIGNLAVADFVYIIVTGPIRIEHEINPCWLSGWITCALRNYAPVVCQCACVYSLVALSRERYTASTSSIHSRKGSQIKSTIAWAISTWVFGILFASPILSVKFSYIYMGILCTYVEHGSSAALIYESSRLLILYVSPLVTISVHYSIMARTLIKSTKKFQENNASFAKQIEARKRLAYLSITLSICFGIFWLPSYIYTSMYNFLSTEALEDIDDAFVIKFRFFHYYMSLANSSLNPWLVFTLSSAHRKYLLQCFRSRVNREMGGSGTSHRSNRQGNTISFSLRHRDKNTITNERNREDHELGNRITSSLL